MSPKKPTSPTRVPHRTVAPSVEEVDALVADAATLLGKLRAALAEMADMVIFMHGTQTPANRHLTAAMDAITDTSEGS